MYIQSIALKEQKIAFRLINFAKRNCQCDSGVSQTQLINRTNEYAFYRRTY